LQMMMLQNSFIMGGRLDRFSNWRLDIDHMTYEVCGHHNMISYSLFWLCINAECLHSL
jgi:hypothetical protein